jgi:hypothetical protein
MADMEWDGQVVDVDGDSFTAVVSRRGDGLELVVDFSLAAIPDVQPGDFFEVVDGQVRRIDLGRWTQGELDEVQRRGRERAARLQGLAE